MENTRQPRANPFDKRPRSSLLCFALVAVCLTGCQKYEIEYEDQAKITSRLVKKLPGSEPEGYELDTAIHFVMSEPHTDTLTYNEFLWIEIFPCGNRTDTTIWRSPVYLADELSFEDEMDYEPSPKDIYAVYAQREISAVAERAQPRAERLCARVVFRQPYEVKVISNTVEFPITQ